jgi:GT2 family glycosyltransferase
MSVFKKMLMIIKAVVNSLRINGFWQTCKKILKRIIRKLKRLIFRSVPSYKLSGRERRRQENYSFPLDIKISILVPLYNTPKHFLTEMIVSVKNQTYANWELCLADGSDEAHGYIRSICTKAAFTDKRIVYKKLDANMGISENTNQCIKISTGEYLGLLDHDDVLHPAALFEVMTAICEKKADFIYTDENTFRNDPRDAYCPNFKSDFAPDMLRSQNYICHFTVFSRELLDTVGMFRSQFDGSQDYDMVLRLTEKAKKIVHIPQVLYYWRATSNSVALDVSVKSYAIEAAKAALTDHLERIGLKGKVEDSRVLSTYRIRYQIKGNPLISIIIPNKDHVSDLKRCIDSIVTLTTYTNYEIIIVENGSTEKATFSFYEQLCSSFTKVKVVVWSNNFNFSAINNFGFKYTNGEYILLLNNDVTVITPDWLQEMLMFAQREDIGAVGAMLYYPDDTIQHAGVIVGLGGVAGHSHKNLRRGEVGFMYRAAIVQNLSAVTAACMMIPRHVYQQMNGLDELFEVAFNDVDLCMRIRKAGYLIVFTPYAELYHFESKSRGLENTAEKRKRFQNEVFRFKEKWKYELEAGDPYYNPNLTLDSEDFAVR